METTWLKAF
jgi:hypothetical protein